MHVAPAQAIEVSRLTKTFGRAARALENVNFTVGRGEMVALIGASGSGKSTLLRHLSGLVEGDRAAGSRITVFGETIQRDGRLTPHIRQRRARIGFVFQQFNLVNRLTVETNVLTGELSRIPSWRSLIHRFSQAERLRAREALDRVGIAQHAGQRASEISGGQQQRAAIARAIMQRADVILADEPIASLDPENARLIMELLAKLNREDGATVVVSLHQVEFALRYCPRTIALRSGAIVYDGASANLTPALLRDLYGSSADELFGSETLARPQIHSKSPDHQPLHHGTGAPDRAAAAVA